MNIRLRDLLKDWSLRDWPEDDVILVVQDAIQYLGRKIFDDYEPSQFDRFEDRLDRWLHNVEDELDQQALFRILHYLFFVGRPESESLCRAALHGPVTRWLIDTLNIDIAAIDASTVLEHAISETWFCPITDSMRINSFLKVNRLDGKSHRPDWRSLRKFADPQKILTYIQDNNIRRIVLLEDFVGSGTQMKNAVAFAAEHVPNLEILVTPLVVCPDGDIVGMDLQEKHANISYDPVLVIPRNLLIKFEEGDDEPADFSNIRSLIATNREKFVIPEPDAESQKCHGFKNTGAMVSLYSNCPNNSLPIFHDHNPNWEPLFPRIKRA